MIIKTTELLHLNEAAKALKQKDFIISINSGNIYIIGIDNIDVCFKYTQLDLSLFSNIALDGIVINARELSAFVKTITLESEFEIKEKDTITRDKYISSYSSELLLKHNQYFNKYRLQKIHDTIHYYSNNIILPSIPEEDISNNINTLFSMHKDDGCLYYKHHNMYFITLFSGLLPLNKSDKVLLTIYNNSFSSFIARFKVVKKHFIVNIYINYLYL